MTIFEHALSFVADGSVIGLGSGRASRAFIEALGARVRAGLRVQGVPTSNESDALARQVGIPLVSLCEHLPLALTVDGADEVDPNLHMIKGYGRALVREKIVAAASRRLIILIGKEKLVTHLGQRGRLPVEVVPFAVPLILSRLADLKPTLLEQDGRPFVSDNGNSIVECHLGQIADPTALERRLRGTPGVVGTGLFLNMADLVLVGDEQRNFELVDELHRSAPRGESA